MLKHAWPRFLSRSFNDASKLRSEIRVAFAIPSDEILSPMSFERKTCRVVRVLGCTSLGAILWTTVTVSRESRILEHIMSESLDKLKNLHEAAPGAELELGIHTFDTDEEAHDPRLQERYWNEMQQCFREAVAECTKLWDTPRAILTYESPDYDDWLERIGWSFIELAVWSRADGASIFVLIDHADRELPIGVIAGTAG